jgi:hypothetical protein
MGQEGRTEFGEGKEYHRRRLTRFRCSMLHVVFVAWHSLSGTLLFASACGIGRTGLLQGFFPLSLTAVMLICRFKKQNQFPSRNIG